MISLAKIWSRMPYLFERSQYFFNGNFWQVLRKNFSKYTTGDILDLACGTGDLRKYISPDDYLGVDINEVYIQKNKMIFHSAKNTNFVQADITNYQTTRKFDVIFFVGSAHHFSDRGFNQICRNFSKTNFKFFIVIDGMPKKMFELPLKFLDGILAGGKFFKDEDRLANLLAQHFQVVSKGHFQAERSFYYYPYVICKKLSGRA